MVNDIAATPTVFNAKSDTQKAYKQIKKYLLNELNTLLNVLSKQFSGLCFNGDLSKHGVFSQLAGFFRKIVLFKIPNATNIKKVYRFRFSESNR